MKLFHLRRTVALFVVVCGLGLWGSLGVAPTYAQTLVDDDGQATNEGGGAINCGGSNNVYQSVGNAVSNASEEVVICPGTYGPDEDLSIDKDLEIKKAAAGRVTIRSDADTDSKQAISIKESGTEITGVEIKGQTKGGSGEMVIEHTSGGANTNATTIDMGSGVEGVTLKNLVIKRQGDLSNTASAIEPAGTGIEIQDVDVTGGPIGFFGSTNGNYTITNTTIRGAGHEGIWVVDANNLTLKRNTIETTSNGTPDDDLHGIAVYNVENQLVFQKNGVSATAAPLLFGDDLPMSVNGTTFTLASTADMRTVLGANDVNGARSGKTVFVTQSDGTLRGEPDSNGNTGFVHVVRTGLTNVAKTGGALAYSQSALGAAKSGDVLRLSDGYKYPGAVTLTSSPQDSSEANIDVSFAVPTSATLDSLHLEGAYTVGVPSGTVTIGDSLTTGSGSTLSGNPVVLGTNATLDDNGLASGTLKATRAVGGGERVVFGNIGFVLTEKGGSNIPGQTTVTRTDGTAPSKANSIQRYYDVSAATNSGLNVQTTFRYDDAELNGAGESKLGVFKSGDGGSTWNSVPVVDFDLTPDSLVTETVSTFSRFTAAETGSTLPVELADFAAETDGRAVQVRWVTASETNNAGFRVQHKTEQGYEPLQFVEGAGTTSEKTDYRYRISGLDYGTHTFRLQQVDQGGTTHLTDPIEVELRLEESYKISKLAPNPVSSRAEMVLTVKKTQDVSVNVYDALGRRVTTLHNGALASGTTHHLRIDAQPLASGAYFLRVQGEQFEATRQIVVAR